MAGKFEFELTPAAAAQILRSAQQQQGTPTLRVAAKRAEDGSIVYGIGFDDPRENDTLIECHGVTILLAEFSRGLLDRAVLDFVEQSPGEYQFVFLNPNEAGERSEGGSRRAGQGQDGPE
jgi:Fe-S cluster assembly iron-binding protein IscA